jgi:hypothetical protein
VQLKRDGTGAETRFRLSEKWTSPFKSAGARVQLTTGSQGVRTRQQVVIVLPVENTLITASKGCFKAVRSG